MSKPCSGPGMRSPSEVRRNRVKDACLRKILLKMALDTVWGGGEYREGREDDRFRGFRKYFSLVQSQLIQYGLIKKQHSMVMWK
jgi:hypothetical protein